MNHTFGYLGNFERIHNLTKSIKLQHIIRHLFTDHRYRKLGTKNYNRLRYDFRRSHLIMSETNDEVPSSSTERYAFRLKNSPEKG